LIQRKYQRTIILKPFVFIDRITQRKGKENESYHKNS
jgi:hypothetical protein